LTREESKKLKKGEEAAIKILKNAGANHIFHSGTGAAHVGGLVRIQEHLDERLQTEYINLHVCDGSVIPENIRSSPTLTLVCLGKYLARHLLSSL
jgi:choline dehydrogenase-like flavoprotein